ncbi:DNA/RNA helicase, superfamily I [Desulfosporosinus orientis DSM 765]|uniref:DNA/RNA helicase, superfamily I n=1 Tax=Desulfosporosinus orientis (strain ATCC 19365 / DSM 765 / NCIMB 8382 / VKM B-1628 / Singapore I) TaxID=768706 RepID=G7WHC1_DESOD|nr:DNA/RNA helicase, superfamily I [Desulfosporosinus orientis DSM 765]
MDSYRQNYQEEAIYLRETVNYLSNVLGMEQNELAASKKNLIDVRKEMWESAVHVVTEYEDFWDMQQYLTEVTVQTANVSSDSKRLKKYQKMINSPYFGRFDFSEEGFQEKEKIYIGLHNLVDKDTQKVYVYDWRAPIASIFYRFELGTAEYETPVGMSRGKVSLKRQYKIKNSKLKYFFDCSVRITDEMLQEVLSQNASVKMRNIVETIQKEQDVIIRDRDNELLIVQGVAGSGKTSIALHRIAFLLYEGLNSNLHAHQVMVVSPHSIFTNYIESVLPELGEENVEQTTFDSITEEILNHRFGTDTRENNLETLIQSRVHNEGSIKKESINFKGSMDFKRILDRLLWYYAHHLIEFEDVYYNGIFLNTRQQLKNRFLKNDIGIPMAKQLKKIETMLLDKVHPLQRQRLNRLEKIVERSEGHEFEIKSYSRWLSIKQAGNFLRQIQRFTKVDYWDLYKTLFTTPGLMTKLAKEIQLPETIESIISMTVQELQKGQVSYEDYPALLYLNLKVNGSDWFSGIKQVVIDEAQDYSLIQYEVFKLLFKNANYTVLGDIQQTIEKEADESLYEDIAAVLAKQTMVQLRLNKGYRSTYEINRFTQGLLGISRLNDSFERHGKEPKVIYENSIVKIDRGIIQSVSDFLEFGYESVAVICKTQEEAFQLHSRLSKSIPITLIKPQTKAIVKGALVIPSYMAKGLEFDAVIVYGGEESNYSSLMDKKLLYIACSRALHQLVVYFLNYPEKLNLKNTQKPF